MQGNDPNEIDIEQVPFSSSLSSTHYHQNEAESTFSSAVSSTKIELLSSPRSNITDFIDSCRSLLNSSSSSSSSSSSITYTKVLKTIQEYALSTSEDKVKIRMQLLGCTAEYVMLMLGGNKYRQKRVRLTPPHPPPMQAPENSTRTMITNDKQEYNHIRQHFESKIVMNTRSAAEKKIVISNDQLVHCLPDSALYDMADTTRVGKWGEELVYNYLSAARKEAKVTWMNKDVESKACYDLTVVCPIDVHSDDTTNDLINATVSSTQGRSKRRWSTTFIEVKTTRFSDNNVFELTLWEYEFATANPKVPYHIYRVYNAGDSGRVYIVIIKDFFESIKEGAVKLCLAI